MEKILQGVVEYRRKVLPTIKSDLVRLSKKPQAPKALLITCSDSRLHPNLYTQTDPGDLFLLRNAGNIIPPYGNGSGGEAATIEYAVSVLGVKNIIVCGHSGCGAMAALLRAADFEEYPSVTTWFRSAEATRRIVLEKHRGAPKEEMERRASEVNVLVQLSNLQTHPCVAAKTAMGELDLHGWLYELETGEVLIYDRDLQQFVPPAETNLPPAVNVSPAMAAARK